MRHYGPLALAALACAAGAASCRELFVSPQGTPGGDGAQARPLDLKTALASETLVKPGDTVWLLGGTYQGPFIKPARPAGTEK